MIGLTQSQRAWDGVQLTVTDYRAEGEGTHPLPFWDQARLSVVLEECGGPCEPRFRPDQPCPTEHIQRHMHFAPAGLEMWGYSKTAKRVADAVLVFDFDILGKRLATRFDANKTDVPQPRFANDAIWYLVKLLSDAVDNPDPSMGLYGDGIIAAVTSQLFADPKIAGAKVGGLVAWQLRRVIDYIEEHFPDRIELETLAALVNLSQAHFSRAFKVSTGLAPYQWQLDARIRRAQSLLANTNASLGEVAQATGFADAVHFGRTFRKITGVTPGVWRSASKR